jgi:hypothetical protein
VAGNGQLPGRLAKQNGAGVPAAAIVGLGVAASVLAVVGGLSRLVEAASLVFLVTFAAVCGIAWLQRTAARWIVGTGFLLAAACAVTITVRLLLTAPLTLGALAVVVALAAVGRPLMERHR